MTGAVTAFTVSVYIDITELISIRVYCLDRYTVFRLDTKALEKYVNYKEAKDD